MQLTDADEWESGPETGFVHGLHIELRRAADLLLIAPLSANMLGKIANGLCDNLLVKLIFINIFRVDKCM